MKLTKNRRNEIDAISRTAFLQVSNAKWDEALEIIRGATRTAYMDGYNEGVLQAMTKGVTVQWTRTKIGNRKSQIRNFPLGAS